MRLLNISLSLVERLEEDNIVEVAGELEDIAPQLIFLFLQLQHGVDGGSGGGGGAQGSNVGTGGSATAGQGNDGGDGNASAPYYGAGGGGGSAGAGVNGTNDVGGGAGGNGTANDIVETGTDVYYGGAERVSPNTSGSGGSGVVIIRYLFQ